MVHYKSVLTTERSKQQAPHFLLFATLQDAGSHRAITHVEAGPHAGRKSFYLMLGERWLRL